MDCGSKQGNDSVLVKRNLMGRVWISRTTTEQVEIVSVWRSRPRSLLIGSMKIPWTTHCWGHWQGRQCHKGHSTRQRCSRRCRGLGDLAAWPSPVTCWICDVPCFMRFANHDKQMLEWWRMSDAHEEEEEEEEEEIKRAISENNEWRLWWMMESFTWLMVKKEQMKQRQRSGQRGGGRRGGEEDMKRGKEKERKRGKEKERKRGRVTRKMTAITAFGFPNLRFTFTAR